MTAAEGVFLNRNDIFRVPEINPARVGDELGQKMRRTMEMVQKWGEKKKDNWLLRIGTGAVGEKNLTQFSGAVMNIEDQKTRTDVLTHAFSKLFYNQSEDRIVQLAHVFSQSVDNLKQVNGWSDVVREIRSVGQVLRLSEEELRDLVKTPRVFMATAGAPRPWDAAEASSPPPPVPSLGGRGPKPPQRDFMGWLRDALRPQWAGLKHHGRLLLWGLAVTVVGGVVIVGGSRILGSVAENASVPQIGEAATLRDKIARVFAGYENRYDTESITYGKILDGKPPSDWSIEQQLNFLKSSDDATRVASLAALRTELVNAGINNFTDAQTYFARYYSGTQLTDLMIMVQYSLQSGLSGFPDTHGFDSYFNIPTPTPTPAISPTPEKPTTPTPRVTPRPVTEYRKRINELTRDQKSRQAEAARKTGNATKGFRIT